MDSGSISSVVGEHAAREQHRVLDALLEIGRTEDPAVDCGDQTRVSLATDALFCPT